MYNSWSDEIFELHMFKMWEQKEKQTFLQIKRKSDYSGNGVHTHVRALQESNVHWYQKKNYIKSQQIGEKCASHFT